MRRKTGGQQQGTIFINVLLALLEGGWGFNRSGPLPPAASSQQAGRGVRFDHVYCRCPLPLLSVVTFVLLVFENGSGS